MVLYKSEPEAMGQVMNLSVGGIAFDGNINCIQDAENVQLDLLMTEKGIYLHNIPYAVVPIRTGGRGRKNNQKFRTNALRFKRLDGEKEVQLRELLAHHVG
ncbi:MAG: PilZ domain-containing protein [Deltaproteobacteria bacterium]|nr:PilZ domain-containing protein [Deltaproteobacteria bacterium]